MIKVEWTKLALFELDTILTNASSPKGAATIERRISRAVKSIATFPRGSRHSKQFDWYEAVVQRAPYLLLYRLIDHADGTRARIIGVFDTNRDPKRKPRRRR